MFIVVFWDHGGCPSRSPPASRWSTGAAAVAASLNELVAPALCSCVHLTSPNLWLLQHRFFTLWMSGFQQAGLWLDSFFGSWCDLVPVCSLTRHSLQLFQLCSCDSFPIVFYLGLLFFFTPTDVIWKVVKYNTSNKTYLSKSKTTDFKNYFKKVQVHKNYSIRVTRVNVICYFPSLQIRWK